MALLSIKDVSVEYSNGFGGQPTYAVNHVNLEVEKKHSLGLIGESGSGKSTLMHSVLRVLNPKTSKVTGSIQLDGKELLTMSPEELSKVRWREMAVVFQKAMNSVSPVHRIGSFMGDIYHIHEPEADRATIKKRVEELLDMVNLPPRVAKMYPHELSGGMMQRVNMVKTAARPAIF